MERAFFLASIVSSMNPVIQTKGKKGDPITSETSFYMLTGLEIGVRIQRKGGNSMLTGLVCFHGLNE